MKESNYYIKARQKGAKKWGGWTGAFKDSESAVEHIMTHFTDKDFAKYEFALFHGGEFVKVVR